MRDAADNRSRRSRKRYDEVDARREEWAREAPADAAIDENRPADVLAGETVQPGAPRPVFRPNKLTREYVIAPDLHQDTAGEELAEAEDEAAA